MSEDKKKTSVSNPGEFTKNDDFEYEYTETFDSL